MKRKSSVIVLAGLLSSTQVFATMTPEFERGDKIIHHTSPRGIQEVCVIPAKYPETKYSKKDLKKELELCNTSFYAITEEQAAAGMRSSALCAKTNSTNPAINIYEIDESKNQTKEALEANECEGAGKIGKYKNSTSCSYTPSIIGYYCRVPLFRTGQIPLDWTTQI